jgi:2-deoxy-scyllo-inosamine dehydrogenase (SAM-dependent)
LLKPFLKLNQISAIERGSILKREIIHSLEGCIKYAEIEVNSRCNRKCDYCPVSVLPSPEVPLYMDDIVFNKIIEELVRIKFSGVFSYHFYNEPLLRNDLEELVIRVSSKLPDTFQVIYTNGDFLSNQRYESLCKAGINRFIVTCHSLKPIDERPRQTVQFPEDLKITNRGGIMSKLKKPLAVPCYSPSERLIVTVIGDVLVCCNDAGRTQVMGNITLQTLEDIWFGKKFVHIRGQLRESNRGRASQICRHCDDTEYFAPGEDNYKEIFK